MDDREIIEVYEWPENTTRSTDVALECIERERTAPIPSVGDIFLLPAPIEAVIDGTVDPDEFYIMRGAAKAYRVVGREFMYGVRPKGAQPDTPLKLSKVWIFVRALTAQEYWSTQP
ncbi:MAG: hypothetical protein AB1Z98_39570 [Nannocystaceae bacterium]